MESHAPESTVTGVIFLALPFIPAFLNKLMLIGLFRGVPRTICAKLNADKGNAGLTRADADEKMPSWGCGHTWHYSNPQEAPQAVVALPPPTAQAQALILGIDAL